MQTAPLIAVGFAASIVTCFAPEQDCAELRARVIERLNSANTPSIWQIVR